MVLQVEGNPCLAYAKLVVFPWFGQLQVSRKPEAGGEKCAPPKSVKLRPAVSCLQLCLAACLHLVLSEPAWTSVSAPCG